MRAHIRDSLDDAVALHKHLHSLAKRPPMNGRDTVVVAGGGFTGIEPATEMPGRLREILGKDTKTRVIIVDGYGLDAAIRRWGHLGKSTVTDALREGRRLLGTTNARSRAGRRTGSRDVKPAA